MKFIVLFCLAVTGGFVLIFAGCKIKVTVPEGGRVVSKSGAFECASGQECTIDIYDLYFDEEFVAEPSPGNVFVKWCKLDRGLCGDKQSPCRIISGWAQVHEVFMELLESDEMFYLVPVFKEAGPIIAYAVASFDKLFTIDMSTGSVTFVGNMGPLINGLAMDSSGNLFGHDASQALWRINTKTGVASMIGDGDTDTNTVGIPGLDFNGTTLTGLDDGDGHFRPAVFTFNTSTGDATLLVELEDEIGKVGAMTIMDSKTAIVSTELGNSLRKVDLISGAITTLATGVPRFLGLDFLSDGNLYGLTPDGAVYKIDATTGAYTQIWDTGDHYWLSIAGPGARCIGS